VGVSAENFDQLLRTLLHRRPFRPFLVELNDGGSFLVDDPEAVAYNNGAAGFIGTDIVHFFSFETVREKGPSQESLV
jgi:hypothetical protein